MLTQRGIPDSHASTVFYREMNTLTNDYLECVIEAAADFKMIIMFKEYIQLRRNDNLKLEIEEQQERKADQEQAHTRIFIEWEAKARKEAYFSKNKAVKLRTLSQLFHKCIIRYLKSTRREANESG